MFFAFLQQGDFLRWQSFPDIFLLTRFCVSGDPLAWTRVGISKQHRSREQRGRGWGHRWWRGSGFNREGALASYTLVSRIGSERLDRCERADRNALLLSAAGAVAVGDDAPTDAVATVSLHCRCRMRRHEAARRCDGCCRRRSRRWRWWRGYTFWNDEVEPRWRRNYDFDEVVMQLLLLMMMMMLLLLLGPRL